MESWDDDNFEPPAVTPAVVSNKWEGEDEDEDVKENWEDEEEEEEKNEIEEIKPKPKKVPLAERIAEKERLKREAIERKIRDDREMTEEEKQEMQKESDLKAALETTFGGDTNNISSSCLDGLSLPSTNEEFLEFTETLSKKLLTLSKSTEYPLFVENLLRNVCTTLNSLDIKKIKNTIDNLYLEKQKIEKGEKSKKSKGKGKAKLKMDDNNPLSAYVNDYDEFDDFM